VSSASTRRFGVLLQVAYDGTPFSGWARQTRVRTVSGELEGAIAAIDPRAGPLRGVSRTDAGVHARGQLAAFDTDQEIDARGWALALAQHLPEEIGITRAAPVPVGFDPRGHVVRKLYRYVVLRSQTRDPLWHRRAWRVGHRLNQQIMQEEALQLVGEHDFAAFRGAADGRVETVRRVLRAQVRNSGGDERCLEIEVEGNRFLYHMVRIIVGTLVDVGRGQLDPGAIRRAYDSRSRDDLGMTAPPDGLYLERIELDQPPVDAWPAQLPAN
jgi:tRNA pseudouridine38-40 synthase